MAERLMDSDVPGWRHQAAAGAADTAAIFGRSAGLSCNLAGQPTDALLHAAAARSGKMEGAGMSEYACVCVCIYMCWTRVSHSSMEEVNLTTENLI